MKSFDRWSELRHRFVLTPEEKRVISFIVITFFLGLATKCYRDAHPQIVEKKSSANGKIYR